MTDNVVSIDQLARAFVRVYRLPDKLTDGFCFGGGKPITFINVDWFEARIAGGRPELEAFIRSKMYFDPSASFLVLGDHPHLTFTIDAERKPFSGGRYA